MPPKPQKKSRLQLNRLIASAIESVARNHELQNTTVALIAQPFVHYVYSNAPGLKKVLVSLLAYAARLAGQGGRVQIAQSRMRGNRFSDSCDYVKVSITICGQGISTEMLQAVSNHFSQLAEALTEPGEMKQNQLSSCREFVRKAGGNIWLKSNLEEGLSFNFNIPLLKEIKLRGVKRNHLVSRIKIIDMPITDSAIRSAR